MAFDFLAAAAGFSSGAADAIEERNKELQRNAEDEVKAAVKAAESYTTKMNTRRSELKDTADVISEYSQGRLTKTQIAGILQTPAVAKDFAAKLQKAKRIEDVDFSAVYKLAGGQPTAAEEQDVIPQTIDRMTRPPKPTTEEPTPQFRGAFGLPTKAYSGTIAAGERAAGMSLGQMRAIAKGVPELTEQERIKGKLDLSQFEDPESLTNIQGKLRDNMTNGIPFGDAKNAKLVKQLQAAAIIKDTFDKEKGEGDKPRTTAAINSVFDKTLRAGLDPFITKGVVRFDPQTNDYVPITGDAKSIKDFIDQKNTLIQNQAVELGLIKDGRVNKDDRNAQDALRPYANIDKDGKVTWKNPAEVKPPIVDVPPANPTTPKVGAPSTVTENPMTIPKTADGKIDGTKLMPGQKYKSADGSTKTWNGKSFQ
jgi:hypothetical protein